MCKSKNKSVKLMVSGLIFSMMLATSAVAEVPSGKGVSSVDQIRGVTVCPTSSDSLPQLDLSDQGQFFYVEGSVAQGDPRPKGSVVENNSMAPKGRSCQEMVRKNSNIPAVQQVRAKYAPQVNQLRMQIKAQRLELVKMLMENNPDKNAVKAKVDQVAELKRRQQQILVEQMFETLKHLTPEQKQEYLRPIIERSLR